VSSFVRLAEAVEPAMVGGKAARLGHLIRAGFRVPRGGVVPIGVHEARLAGELPPAFASTLVARLRQEGLVDGPFAVRSSAAGEDSGRASFAGQFRSVLHVSIDDVPAAVTEVQDSVANPSAAAYAARMRVPAPTTLAVIVQEQVRARRAGICFTVDPVTGGDEVIVEYAEGLGDAVAGGSIVPVETRRLHRAWCTGERARDDEVIAVACLALRIANLMGTPQDVEWAIDVTGIWTLQSRPITTIR
jgi:phosphoenolpyruvate synthase/pyruvate phosphate dikinase